MTNATAVTIAMQCLEVRAGVGEAWAAHRLLSTDHWASLLFSG